MPVRRAKVPTPDELAAVAAAYASAIGQLFEVALDQLADGDDTTKVADRMAIGLSRCRQVRDMAFVVFSSDDRLSGGRTNG